MCLTEFDWLPSSYDDSDSKELNSDTAISTLLSILLALLLLVILLVLLLVILLVIAQQSILICNSIPA
jgi:hypothetical protein